MNVFGHRPPPVRGESPGFVARNQMFMYYPQNPMTLTIFDGCKPGRIGDLSDQTKVYGLNLYVSSLVLNQGRFERLYLHGPRPRRTTVLRLLRTMMLKPPSSDKKDDHKDRLSGVGIFHAKGWGSKSLFPPSKVRSPRVSTEFCLDVADFWGSSKS